MRHYYLFFALTCTSPLSAQTIEGWLTDRNGIPVPSAAIFINGEATTNSDTAGYFSIHIAAGTYTLSIIHPLYDTLSIRLQLSAGEHKQLRLTLTPYTEPLPPTTIPLPRPSPAPPTIYQLPRPVVERVPLPTIAPEAILAYLPGVATTSESATRFSVRGGNFDENLVLVEDFEIYRPQLARATQQEAPSVAALPLTENMDFYSGGFPARYGLKVSSALLIKYAEPTEKQWFADLSLMGITVAHMVPSRNYAFQLLTAARYYNPTLTLSASNLTGRYSPRFTDWQMLARWQATPSLRLVGFAYLSEQKFSFTPRNEQVRFGTLNQPLLFTMYMDGSETDITQLATAAIRTHWQVSTRLQGSAQLQVTRLAEHQNYDLTGAYLLGIVQNDPSAPDYGQILYALGTGELHRWARERLYATILSAKTEIEKISKQITWQAGTGISASLISSRISKWTREDSAGYSLPYSDSEVLLRYNFKSSSQFTNPTAWAYAQTTLQLTDKLRLYAGIRTNLYPLIHEWVVEPRLRLSTEEDSTSVSWWVAGGVYTQPPFYRELLQPEGTLNFNIKSVKSLHLTAGVRKPVPIGGMPLLLTASAYFKYLWDINPYDLSEIFIEYWAENVATGYTAGVEAMLYGEFVRGLPSWFAITLSKSEEKITKEDTTVVVPRPVDERLRLSVFFQDFLPHTPWIQVFSGIVFGTGLPFSPPPQAPEQIRLRWRNAFRMKDYLRVDVGMLFNLISERTHPSNPLLKNVKEIWAGLHIYNLLDRENVSHYLWIKDLYNVWYAVPRRLTGRVVSVRVMVRW